MTQYWVSQHGLLQKETKLAPNSTKGCGKHFCNQSHPSRSGSFLEFAGVARFRKAPQTKRGTLSDPHFPGAWCRASPPRARATRPGGRRRPSLPQGRPCSTIGAGRLNFRVRYGSGCAPAAVAAGPRGALRRGLRRAGRRSQGALGAAQRSRKLLLENGRERRDALCVPKGSAD